MKRIILVLIALLLPTISSAAMQTYANGDALSAIRTKILANDAELYGHKVASGSITGNNLTLVLADASTIVVDVSSLLDNTDAQTVTAFSLNSSTNVLTITLSGGNTQTVDLSGLVSAGGLTDADSDGTTYGRKDGEWVAVGTGTGEANVQADWAETVTGSDAFIKNKPTIPQDADDISDTTTDNKFVTNAEKGTWNAKQDALTNPVVLADTSAWDKNASDDFDGAYGSLSNPPTIPVSGTDFYSKVAMDSLLEAKAPAANPTFTGLITVPAFDAGGVIDGSVSVNGAIQLIADKIDAAVTITATLPVLFNAGVISIPASTYQAYSANLTSWAAIAPSAKQDAGTYVTTDTTLHLIESTNCAGETLTARTVCIEHL